MYNIAIRADGGPAVGMGHIMRCLAVAEELKALGYRVYFISRYQQGIDNVVTMGFESFKINIETHSISTLGFNYGSVEELKYDLQETLSIMEQQNCDLILVDKYNLTTEYFDRLAESISKVAFIDDLNLYKCSADIIINGNINAPLLKYEKGFEGQILLIGTEYIPLRKEFRSITKRELRDFTCYEQNSNCKISYSTEDCGQYPEIMITTGGADPYNCTGRLLEILLSGKKTCNMRFNVIVSSGFVYKDQLHRMADENHNIVIYIDPDCMSDIMCRSDLAISSGGSTLYELSCCGTPTLAFIMADNQKGIVDALAIAGYVYSLGWYNQLEDSNLAEIVLDFISDFKLRKKCTDKMQSLIDGRGAKRIAQKIIDIINNTI